MTTRSISSREAHPELVAAGKKLTQLLATLPHNIGIAFVLVREEGRDVLMGGNLTVDSMLESFTAAVDLLQHDGSAIEAIENKTKH
jgi:hypothetical protein